MSIMSTNLIDLDFTIGLRNKSDLDIVLFNQKFDVLINGNLLTTILVDNPFIMKSNSTSQMPLHILVDTKNLKGAILSNISDLILHRDKVIVSIKGNVGVKVDFIRVPSYKIELKDTLTNWMSTKPSDVDWECKD